MMDYTISILLKNTSQSVTNGNNSRYVKFEPKIPSGIDITQMPMENKLNPSYEHEITVLDTHHEDLAIPMCTAIKTKTSSIILYSILFYS